MSLFVIKKCEIRACQWWRLGDNCIKNGSSISHAVQYSSDLHSAELCQVREQINKYRMLFMKGSHGAITGKSASFLQRFYAIYIMLKRNKKNKM